MELDDLAYLSAIDLATAIRSRKLSPVEVTKSILVRIERLNPALNAFVTVPAEAALCAAKKAEEQAKKEAAEAAKFEDVDVGEADEDLGWLEKEKEKEKGKSWTDLVK